MQETLEFGEKGKFEAFVEDDTKNSYKLILLNFTVHWKKAW